MVEKRHSVKCRDLNNTFWTLVQEAELKLIYIYD